ncbi:MAG: hypothetical protein Q4A24_06880 [Akkermansia sp.]|nr:hypothetical protein [Akkermansia sp.]
MKLRLNPSLYRAVLSVLALAATTLGSFSTSALAAVTIDSSTSPGYVNEDGAVYTNADMKSRSGNYGVWSGDEETETSFTLNKDGLLYVASDPIRSNNTSVDTEVGINVEVGSGSTANAPATIASGNGGWRYRNRSYTFYKPTTETITINGAVTGSGYLRLQGNSTSSTTFAFGASGDKTDWFTGTVSLANSLGGDAYLQLNDDRWQGAVIDFSRESTTTGVPTSGSNNNLSYSSDTPDTVGLTLTANAAVKGLSGGSNISAATVTGAHTLTVGTDEASDYTYGGGLDAELSITKVGSNTQSFSSAVSFNTLTLQGGTLNTQSTVTIGTANLSAGTEWTMGRAATVDNLTLEGVGYGDTVALTGGSLTVNNLFSYSGTDLSADAGWFTLSNTSLSFDGGMNISGVDILDDATSIKFADIASGTVSVSGSDIYITATDGNGYIGAFRTEDSAVYIDLRKDEWPPIIDPAVGFIWSGETNGTTFSDHRGLVMGTIWRADGSAVNTGWHEQSAGKGAGVYVDGNKVVFADTNYHGDAVGASGRKVEIVGNVAPGLIHVTADNESGVVSNNAEARLQYGYAFYSEDSTSGITDYVAPDGTRTPTKIVKDGKAMLVLDTINSFSGGIDVNQGGLYLAKPNSAGTGTITVHTDNTWELPVWNSINNRWDYHDKQGAEMMVCYLHSNETASGFRSGTVANDIVMQENDANKAGRFTISFATAAFNLSGTDDHANVPRHWRNLTLSGALVGTGNKNDELVLTGYSSTWSNYRDQSYVTSFTFNEKTKTDQSLTSNFNGTIVLKNTINTSPLYSNRLDARTAGTVQVMLQDKKLQYAYLDMTRESVVSGFNNETDPRQVYNTILVLTGEVGLRGLSADFHGNGYVYEWDGDTSYEDGSSTRTLETLAQNEEVWHVRTVANATATLRLGQHEDDASSVYVYSGAMGFAQSYVEPTEGHVLWGDGFDAPPTSTSDGFYDSFKNSFHMGLETLSLIKESGSAQYIHTALLNDVSLYGGVLGFNSMELMGNMRLVGGSNLKLGVTGEIKEGLTWNNIAEGTTSSLPTTTENAEGGVDTYAVVPTTDTVQVGEGKALTIYTAEPDAKPGTAAYVPTAAVVDGNVSLSTGSSLVFEVNKVEPWFLDFPENKSLSDYTEANPLPSDSHGPSENMLLDVNGALNLMSNTADMEIRFRGVNFSLTPFSDRLYYLVEANNITVGGTGDSSEFASRLITLGYGYFGMVDTLDSSNAAHNTNGLDYLVMTVMGDPRHTWSGATELTDGSFVWNSYTGAADDTVPAYDYRWKENTPFMNGHVVLFGNLYNPKEWVEDKHLTSDKTVRVVTDGTISAEQSATLAGHSVLLDGTVATTELLVNNLNENARFGTNYQKVEVQGEVAPLSIIIGSEYLDVTSGTEVQTEDDTNYWFFGDGVIRDATASELSSMFDEYSDFDGSGWKTNLEKYGSGTAVIATANTFSGGTLLHGGKIVMQHKDALGKGGIIIANGATLQGDFADDRSAEYWPGYDGAYVGEGMQTSTVANPVDVRLTMDPENDGSAATAGRVANAVDKKMVLTSLSGDAGSVVTLYGYSAPETGDDVLYSHDGENKRPAYTYAVFKVLDPSAFYGTVRMDGNIWGQPEGAAGGKVQMEIMTTDKSTASSGQNDDSQKKDWLNTQIDLSVTDGTERTVLAFDPIELTASGEATADTQEALINALNGTGDVRMADGAINSSVVNMSEIKHVTLVIKGLSSGDYDGVLGYGDFQRTTEYGTDHRHDIPAVGETCHHYGCGTFGDLNVRKEGSGTTQSVYNAWIADLEVAGGVFAVDHVLQVRNIDSGAGNRVFVGQVSDLNTVYALTVGDGGVLSMDTQLYDADGNKYDAWQDIKAGANNEGAGNVGWVQLQNGATLTAHSDWFTDTQVEIENGSSVTVNTHNFTPDAFITSDHDDHAHIDEDGTAHEHFGHFNTSHIIQLLGKLSGRNLHLTFTNEQMSPGANAQELGGSDYMGYVAIKDHNQMTGALLVKEQTVLQVLNSASTQADMDVTVDGTDAAMQVVGAAQTQYVDSLTVRNGGALLLGGLEKTSLADGDSALKSIDYTQELVRLSVSNRFADKDGTMSTVHADLSEADLSEAAARIGGSSDLNSDASNVHITAHSAGKHEVHDTNLHSSLVELKAGTSMSLDDNVLIDKESVVFGSLGMVDMNAPQTLAVTDMQFDSIEPQAATENVTVGTTTTLELTTSGGTIYRAGNTNIYHVTADQLHNVNVSGSGLTIQLMDDSFLYSAFASGAGYVAIQISGLGQFLFEDNADAFTLNNWMLMDASGVDITSSWVTSSVVSDDTGVDDVSSHMLYIMVPEPATATLSLLALCALAARRRRRA